VHGAQLGDAGARATRFGGSDFQSKGDGDVAHAMRVIAELPPHVDHQIVEGNLGVGRPGSE
jgi:hypothetical protein